MFHSCLGIDFSLCWAKQIVEQYIHKLMLFNPKLNSEKHQNHITKIQAITKQIRIAAESVTRLNQPCG